VPPGEGAPGGRIGAGTRAADSDTDVALELQPSGKLRLGQRVEVRIACKRRGWLVLLDVNSAGDVSQLLANGVDANWPGAGGDSAGSATGPAPSYAVTFVADKPTGKGTLIAIVSEEATSVEALAKQYVAAPANTGDLSRTIQQLRTIWAKEGSKRTLRWSMTEAVYDITP
jgi:hypothetical protein